MAAFTPESSKLIFNCIHCATLSLSSLRPHPFILIGHFFAVAFYAVFRTLRSHPVWSAHRGVYRCIMIFIKACAVIFPLLGSELRTVFPL